MRLDGLRRAAHLPLRTSWPDFGRATALDAATCCASLSSVAAGRREYRLIADVPVYLYGSDAHRRPGSVTSVPKPTRLLRRLSPPQIRGVRVATPAGRILAGQQGQTLPLSDRSVYPAAQGGLVRGYASPHQILLAFGLAVAAVGPRRLSPKAGPPFSVSRAAAMPNPALRRFSTESCHSLQSCSTRGDQYAAHNASFLAGSGNSGVGGMGD
jgi:hypothetical protein